jgi:hypothetical protein
MNWQTRTAGVLSILAIIVLTFVIARSDFFERLLMVNAIEQVGGRVDANPVEPLAARVDQLVNSINELKGDIGELALQANTERKRVDELKAGLGGLFQDLAAERKRVDGKIRDAANDAEHAVANEMTRFNEDVKKILAQISKNDGNRYNPSILTNMDRDPKFRREMERAVDKTIQREGWIKVRNDTADWQMLLVNNREHWIAPYDEEKRIRVPAGTAVTQFANEPPKNWAIAPPEYEQDLIIGFGAPVYRERDYAEIRNAALR